MSEKPPVWNLLAFFIFFCLKYRSGIVRSKRKDFSSTGPLHFYFVLGLKGEVVKCISTIILGSILWVGCATSKIEKWNHEKNSGRVVVYSSGDLGAEPSAKDAHEKMIERCPSGYTIVEEGWQNSGTSVTRDRGDAQVTEQAKAKYFDFKCK